MLAGFEISFTFAMANTGKRTRLRRHGAIVSESLVFSTTLVARPTTSTSASALSLGMTSRPRPVRLSSHRRRAAPSHATVGQLRADHHAAVAVILLLAVEGCSRPPCRSSPGAMAVETLNGNALVGRTEHGVDVGPAGCYTSISVAIFLSVERAERGDLPAVIECTGIDEVPGLRPDLSVRLLKTSTPWIPTGTV